MDPVTIAAILSGGSAIANLIGGLGQKDPEKIYQERVKAALEYLQNAFSGYEISARSRAAEDVGQAQRIGARQAASHGYTGGAAPFTSPAEASISARLAQTLESIRNSKTLSLANVKMSGLDFPIINKPNAFQYVGQLLSSGSDIMGTIAKGQAAEKAMSVSDDFHNYMSGASSRLTGQTKLDGLLNRIGDIGAPAKGTDYASNFFTFGDPFRPSKVQSPLYFGRN